MVTLLSFELPIGADLFEILAHIVNFIILVIGLRYILYKPIKSFIDKREKEYEELDKTTKEANEKALARKLKYEELVQKTKGEVAKIAEEVTAKTDAQAKVIIGKAKEEAKAIIAEAKLQVDKEKSLCQVSMSKRSSELGLAIAEKILARSIENTDMDKIIDECLEKWD